MTDFVVIYISTPPFPRREFPERTPIWLFSVWYKFSYRTTQIFVILCFIA